MDIRDVKKNLNRSVTFNGSEYILTACIIRRHKKTAEFYYEAELSDVKNGGWIVVCPLREVKEK